jgi:hypothetical protein
VECLGTAVAAQVVAEILQIVVLLYPREIKDQVSDLNYIPA